MWLQSNTNFHKWSVRERLDFENAGSYKRAGLACSSPQNMTELAHLAISPSSTFPSPCPIPAYALFSCAANGSAASPRGSLRNVRSRIAQQVEVSRRLNERVKQQHSTHLGRRDLLGECPVYDSHIWQEGPGSQIKRVAEGCRELKLVHFIGVDSRNSLPRRVLGCWVAVGSSPGHFRACPFCDRTLPHRNRSISQPRFCAWQSWKKGISTLLVCTAEFSKTNLVIANV
jgi:hypothetical protein